MSHALGATLRIAGSAAAFGVQAMFHTESASAMTRLQMECFFCAGKSDIYEYKLPSD